MKVTKQTFATFTRKKVTLANTIHHSSFIYNQFKKLNLCKFYSNRVINHLMSILISIFISGYHGKTTDFAKNSSCHRTTIAHFLNSGKWNDSLLSDTLKQSVIEIIYSEAARTRNPVFCIVDDTIASKTKPLSRALHPIEDAYFHQSHLKKKQDYGQQAVDIFSRNKPGTFDAILMDIMMPEMDGLSATKAIRALDREDAGTIPIIAMTANAFDEDEKKCMEAGMNAHLVKPLDIQKMKEAVCRYLNK